MSLLVKGMDMPKDYKHRDVTLDRTTDDGTLWLSVYDFDSEAMNYSYRSYPLSEIPTPHGRLIDADELTRYIEHAYGDRDIVKLVTNNIARQQTIIEAEE